MGIVSVMTDEEADPWQWFFRWKWFWKSKSRHSSSAFSAAKFNGVRKTPLAYGVVAAYILILH
jgi:hypothetical protein